MKILEIPVNFITPFDARPTGYDHYGMGYGIEHEALHLARTPGNGTRTLIRSPKSSRSMELLSQCELNTFLYCLFHPGIVEIREGYAVYSEASYNRAAARGLRIPKSQVMSIDFDLTIVTPGSPEALSHWVSCKYSSAAMTDSAKRRAEKELGTARSRDTTWEMRYSRDFPKRMTGNLATLWTYFQFSNAWELYTDAMHLSRQMQSRPMQGTMDQILRRHARSLDIPLNQAYVLFSTAVSFGFMTLDHRHIVGADRPLRLLGFNK